MMKDTLKRFQKVEKKLKAKPWFKKEGWIISVHGFPEKNPTAVTFQVFKKNWFNETRQGIHVESFLTIDPKKSQKTYVTLHLLHAPKIPGTQVKRIVLAEAFVDSIFEEVKSWKGYKFRAGRYGQQPFTKVLDGSDENFEAELATETERICLKLGPVVDWTLKNILQT
jgi:hypothetical protein